MIKLLKVAFEIFRGNILCFIKKIIIKKSNYSPYIRISKSFDFGTSKSASFSFGKGVYFGKRMALYLQPDAVIKIGDMASFNDDCKVVCQEYIEIGDNTIFGPNVLIYDHDHLFSMETGVKRKEFKTSPVVIGKNCWIGANTVILRGTTIGDNCLIGAGSVIKGNIPSGSIIIQKRENVYL